MFLEMEKHEFKPEPLTFASLMKAFAELGDYETGKCRADALCACVVCASRKLLLTVAPVYCLCATAAYRLMNDMQHLGLQPDLYALGLIISK